MGNERAAVMGFRQPMTFPEFMYWISCESGKVFLCGLCMTWVLVAGRLEAKSGQIQHGEMAGYLGAPNARVAEEFNAGFSMYVAAWPLLKSYPGPRFQSGLFGTWMFPKQDRPLPFKLYTCIEGGLGWWRDTRFATETPKFIMGGVAPNFVAWANGPGAGKGRDWNRPFGHYGVVQLSPWVLWPPDGLNLKQGTCGELFGYGYLPLPLTPPKPTTAGKNITTGDQWWTLFLNTKNFKGPVAAFTPFFWSQWAAEDAKLEGLLLDSRPSDPNRALQMETQYIPAVIGMDAVGERYARIAPTCFPWSREGQSIVVHRVTSYSKKALWDAVKEWFEGGPPATGQVNEQGAILHKFTGGGWASWRIYADRAPREEQYPISWRSFATPTVWDDYTFGYRWNPDLIRKDTRNGCRVVTLPEYYQLVKKDGKGAEWVPVPPEKVPAETGLHGVRFERARRGRPEPYVTPEEPTSCWKKPGPVAGPFHVELGDGSVVTYYWFRFADQPALLNADLTDAEREELQRRVELIHRYWKKDHEYLPPPTTGELAELDPALLVTPPPGLEVGYVPIVTRQGPKE